MLCYEEGIDNKEVTVTLKYALNTPVYYVEEGTPMKGRIINRAYHEKWNDPVPALDEPGGYTVETYYQVKSPIQTTTLFKESDFGLRCFIDAKAFADFITQ